MLLTDEREMLNAFNDHFNKVGHIFEEKEDSFGAISLVSQVALSETPLGEHNSQAACIIPG